LVLRRQDREQWRYGREWELAARVQKPGKVGADLAVGFEALNLLLLAGDQPVTVCWRLLAKVMASDRLWSNAFEHRANPKKRMRMKRIHLLVLGMVTCAVIGFFAARLVGAEAGSFQAFEYGTIRWAGRENTHFIRPNSTVEMLGPILTKVQRPDRVDERCFYMSLAVNAVAREGFEVCAMTSDEILVKRAAVLR
jgi:hypothetical protein